MKQIIWESQHLEISPISQRIKYFDNEFENEELSPEEQVQSQLTATPFGVWKINDDLHPMKQFKLWMGHTNFNLNKQSVNALSKVKGVELLRILTRYRFIVGIGKAFDVSDVKQEIERIICNKKQTINHSRINKLSDFLSKKYKKWSVLMFPNGNMEYIACNEANKSFLKEKQIFKNITKLTGSYLLEG